MKKARPPARGSRCRRRPGTQAAERRRRPCCATTGRRTRPSPSRIRTWARRDCRGGTGPRGQQREVADEERADGSSRQPFLSGVRGRPASRDDRRNNCTAWVRYYLSNPRGRPNLAPRMAGVQSGDGIAPGHPVPFVATVGNYGDRKSAPTTLHWYLTTDAELDSEETGSPVFTPENEIRTDAIGELYPWATKSWSPPPAPAETGHYQYGLCVDPVPGETERLDNCLSEIRDGVRGAMSPCRPGPGAAYARRRRARSYAIATQVLRYAMVRRQAADRDTDLPQAARAGLLLRRQDGLHRTAAPRGHALLSVAPAAVRQESVPGHAEGALRRQRGAVRGALHPPPPRLVGSPSGGAAGASAAATSSEPGELHEARDAPTGGSRRGRGGDTRWQPSELPAARLRFAYLLQALHREGRAGGWRCWWTSTTSRSWTRWWRRRRSLVRQPRLPARAVRGDQGQRRARASSRS